MSIVADAPTCCGFSFMEVLRMLPLDVVDDNIWHLLSRQEKCALKLTCPESLHLTDQLITSVTHNVPLSGWPWEVSPEDQHVHNRHLDFIARLPHLQVLRLNNWYDGQDLMWVLHGYGDAMQTELVGLSVLVEHQAVQEFYDLNEDTAYAICSAFPNLRELHLGGRKEGDYNRELSQLHGPFFEPFSHVPLTKVSGWANAQETQRLLSLAW